MCCVQVHTYLYISVPPFAIQMSLAMIVLSLTAMSVATESTDPIRKVYIVFSNHLDVGYTMNLNGSSAGAVVNELLFAAYPACHRHCRCCTRKGQATIPLDGTVVDFRRRSPLATPTNPLPTPLRVPEPSRGVHHALCGNMWNTNYPFWYPFAPGERDATSQFRFALELPGASR